MGDRSIELKHALGGVDGQVRTLVVGLPPRLGLIINLAARFSTPLHELANEKVMTLPLTRHGAANQEVLLTVGQARMAAPATPCSRSMSQASKDESCIGCPTTSFVIEVEGVCGSGTEVAAKEAPGAEQLRRRALSSLSQSDAHCSRRQRCTKDIMRDCNLYQVSLP